MRDCLNPGIFQGKSGSAYYVLHFECATPENKEEIRKAFCGSYFRGDDNEFNLHNIFINGIPDGFIVDFKSISIDDITHAMQMALHICQGFITGISIKTPLEYMIEREMEC